MRDPPQDGATSFQLPFFLLIIFFLKSLKKYRVFTIFLLNYWKCNFPINPHVRLSVSWLIGGSRMSCRLVGRMVCQSFLKVTLPLILSWQLPFFLSKAIFKTHFVYFLHHLLIPHHQDRGWRKEKKSQLGFGPSALNFIHFLKGFNISFAEMKFLAWKITLDISLGKEVDIYFPVSPINPSSFRLYGSISITNHFPPSLYGRN